MQHSDSFLVQSVAEVDIPGDDEEVTETPYIDYILIFIIVRRYVNTILKY